jgi:hypothetical protein
VPHCPRKNGLKSLECAASLPLGAPFVNQRSSDKFVLAPLYPPPQLPFGPGVCSDSPLEVSMLG